MYLIISLFTLCCAVIMYPLVEPPQIMNPKEVLHVDLGQDVMLTCNATGGNIKYKWKNGSGSFDDYGVTDRTMVITDVKLSDNSTYTCMASNEGGNVTSNVTLIVNGMILCYIV